MKFFQATHSVLLASLVCTSFIQAATASLPEQNDLFEVKIRPLLVTHCIRCHGETKQEASLKLSTHDGVLKGGESGPIIVPGQPLKSRLLEALRYESLEMPPSGQLDDHVIQAVEHWILRGAPWPENVVLVPANPITAKDHDWWCYQPVTQPQIPSLSEPVEEWCQNEIDYFVKAKLISQKISPSPRASPLTLLRRIHYAITGLPPDDHILVSTKNGTTLQDPEAVTQLVDDLLDQQSYGEHQARFWLDLVRYADSDGYRADHKRPQAKQYRDYIIASFNNDKPYDRFIMEQLAGDEIDPGNRDAVIGTMFLRHWIYEWNQRDVEGQWEKILDDLTETTADVFLAQSIRCARCHDHKFDPLLQKDYYRLRSFFAAFLPNESRPIADLDVLAKHVEQQQLWERATASIRRRLDTIERPLLLKHATGQKPEMFPPKIQAMLAKNPMDRTPYEHQIVAMASRQFELHPEKLKEFLEKDAQEQRQQLLKTLSSYDRLKPEPLPTQAFVASDVGTVAPAMFIPESSASSPINPGFPTLFSPAAAVITPTPRVLSTTGRRTALARWIANTSNPLTARVLINRIWQQHFGRGLSASTNDLGHLGVAPSHPDLLDWLATWFMKEGWSIKKLHRLILTSATYHQTSNRKPDKHIATIDSDNTLLWRMNPRRLSGEEFMDSVLNASGLISPNSSKQRAIYRPVLRNKPDPILAALDLPDRVQPAGKRHQTTTPTQALLFSNGNWLQDQTQNITRTLRSTSDIEFINTLHRRLFSRPPSKNEMVESKNFIRAYETLVSHQPRHLEDTHLDVMPALQEASQTPAVRFGSEADLSIHFDTTDNLPTSHFTVQAHILLRSLFKDAKVRVIASTWTGDPKQPGWSFGITSTKSRYKPRNLILQLVGKTDDGENIHYEVIPSNLHLELNQPYFVAVSVDLADRSENGITFFLRKLGKNNSTSQKAHVPHEVTRFIQTGQPLRLGRRGDAHRWDGLIADFKLSAATLSEHDIASETHRNPVLHWQFRNATAIGQDISGQNNHAVVDHDTHQQLPPHDQARAALLHAFFNTNEVLYID